MNKFDLSFREFSPGISVKALVTGLLVILSFLSLQLFSQVSISTNNNPPDSSAMLDIQSTNKGLLPPRLTVNEIESIVSPKAGLKVFCSSLNLPVYFDGTTWRKMNGDPIFTLGALNEAEFVFYVFPDGLRALIVNGQESTAQWGCGGTLIGGTSTALGSGMNNSTEILASCNTDFIAAQICNNLNPQSGQGWFLPSKQEMIELIASNVIGFVSGDFYWTSSEINATLSWRVNLDASGSINIFGFSKDLSTNVRCIRKTPEGCDSMPTPSDAGPDQLNIPGTSASLQGNSPVSGTGNWVILNGTGGNIAEPSNSVSIFTGIEGNVYILKWTISTGCGISPDNVTVSFACPTASAGADQLDLPGMSTTLAGNTPSAGAGQWTITGGSGGSITNPSDPLSLFTGTPGVNYTLRWTVTSNCATVHDDVNISFACSPQPTQANAGPDLSNIAGVTTTLQGNTPVYGTGTWSVASGANGIIAQPNNPASTFTGTNGGAYMLAWTISNTCGTSVDYVSISFAAFSCGNTFQDTRDGHVYTTLTRGAQCWMKQNLNYATGNSLCYAGNPSNCDNYGRLYDWNTANTACPTNWHLPTDVQWCTLLTGIDGTVSCGATGITGTNAGGNMKETGTSYWAAPNTGATNSSGFTARGGGSTTIPGRNLTQWGSFWTSTTNGSNYWSWEMTYNDARVWHNYYGWSNTMSVRCLKN
jgi:uncharacterized protein (TIGR02145 family)